MATLQPVDRISFVVDVLSVRNGKKLARIRPNEQGYYTVPIAVLGTPTDNRTYYEVEDFVGQLTRPDTFINRVLTDGKLMGEYGHPPIAFMPEEHQINRLMTIDEKCTSHHIKKIWTGETLSTGGKILYALIKPSGPYAAPLKESLDDPCINTSFSLRSVAQGRVVNGLTRRNIKHLVTFDFVNAGGYSEASKRYAPSTESFTNISVDIDLSNKRICLTEAALEYLSNTELNDIFGTNEVVIGSKKVTYITDKKAFRDDKGDLRSIYTELLDRKGA